MISAVLLCCIPILLIIYLYKETYHGSLSSIPKVKWRIPFYGNRLDLSKIHLVLTDWSKQYGPVFRFSLYGEEIIVLNDYKTIYEALVTRGSDFAGRPKMTRTDHADRSRNSVVWQSYTPKLKFLRKHIHSSLRMYCSGVEEFESRCVPELQQLVSRIKRTGNRSFDPWDFLYDSISNIMLDLTLGIRLKYGDIGLQQLKKITILFNHTFGPGSSRILDLLPWSLCSDSQEYKTLQAALDLRDQFWNTYRTEQSNTKSECVIADLEKLSYQRKYDDYELVDSTFKEIFTNLLLAGTDTTTTALSCLILFLLHKPDIQARIHDEIDDVIGQTRSPRLTDRSRMPYLEACLLETLRFISHVPLAVPHATICDTNISGHSLPRGTNVYINLWAMHHDEMVWTKPWTFNPERFLDETGKLSPPSHERRQRLMVFGSGRRICLGETLAKNRLFLFAATLLQNFEFLPDENMSLPEMDPRHYSLGIVLHPDKFNVKIRERLEKQLSHFISNDRKEQNRKF